MQGDELLKWYERAYGPFVHMGNEDKAIWMRYLMTGGNVFAPFEYDVRVGEGITVPVTDSRMTHNLAYALTTKRIDVVCNLQNRIRIIEVKKRAGLGAIGQLIGYRELYLQTFSDGLPVEMLLVTDELQPDLKPILYTSNILYAEVGY